MNPMRRDKRWEVPSLLIIEQSVARFSIVTSRGVWGQTNWSRQSKGGSCIARTFGIKKEGRISIIFFVPQEGPDVDCRRRKETMRESGPSYGIRWLKGIVKRRNPFVMEKTNGIAITNLPWELLSNEISSIENTFPSPRWVGGYPNFEEIDSWAIY